MFKDCFSSHPDHAPYSGLTVTPSYFAWKASIAFSVASCLESQPHQEKVMLPEISPEFPPSALLSPAALVSAVVVVLLPPHPTSEIAVTEAIASAALFIFFIKNFSLPIMSSPSPAFFWLVLLVLSYHLYRGVCLVEIKNTPSICCLRYFSAEKAKHPKILCYILLLHNSQIIQPCCFNMFSQRLLRQSAVSWLKTL